MQHKPSRGALTHRIHFQSPNGPKHPMSEETSASNGRQLRTAIKKTAVILSDISQPELPGRGTNERARDGESPVHRLFEASLCKDHANSQGHRGDFP